MLTTRPTLLHPPAALAAAAPAGAARRASSQPSAAPSAAPNTGFAALMQRQAEPRALAMGGRGERPPLASSKIERPAEAPRPARAEALPPPGAAHARSTAGPARLAAPANTLPETLAQRASPAQVRLTALAQALNSGLARARSASAASPAAGLGASRAPGAADGADSSLSAIQRDPKAASPATDNTLPAAVLTPSGWLPQTAPPPAMPDNSATVQGSGPRSASVAAVGGSSQPGPGTASAGPGMGGPGGAAPGRADANSRPIAAEHARRNPPGARTEPGVDAADPTHPMSDSDTGLQGTPATAAEAASNPALSAVHAPKDASTYASTDAPADAPHNAPQNATAVPGASPAAGAAPCAATQPAGANPPPWLGRDRAPSGVGRDKAGTAHESLEPVPLNGWVSSASASTATSNTETEPAKGSRAPPSTDLAAGQTAVEADRSGAARPATQAGPAAADALAMAAPLAQPSAPTSAQAGAVGTPAVPVEARIAVPLHSPLFAPALGAQISLFAQDGVQTARLMLNPAELGPVSVQIVLDGNAARVDFQADRAATRDVIEASLPALASALQDVGLTLAGGGLSQQPSGQPSPQRPPTPAAPAAPGTDGQRVGSESALSAPVTRTPSGRLLDLVA